MSAFNVLNAEITCSNCGNNYCARIQFKFGNTAFLQYHLGDMIKWGGNDIGKAGLKKVKAYGILESTTCPICRSDNAVEEYDIFIQNDIIVGVTPMESIECYLDEGSSEYVVLEK